MLFTPFSSGKWNKNVSPCWSVTSSLDKVIRQLEIADVDLLPDLSSHRSLILTSDYGGQHKTAIFALRRSLSIRSKMLRVTGSTGRSGLMDSRFEKTLIDLFGCFYVAPIGGRH